jgi:hypothetical protein
MNKAMVILTLAVACYAVSVQKADISHEIER